MAASVALSVLRRQSRELADEINSSFVADTELNGMINSSISQWYDLILEAVPERYETIQTITANGAASYALPAAHYKTLAVEYQSTDAYVDIPRVQFRERNRFPTKASGSRALAYRLTKNDIALMPPPTSGTYRHLYAPTPTVLSQDTDTLDGVNGWEQWVVYDCAIKMLLKGESEILGMVAERERIERSLRRAAADRELANPKRIVDVRSRLVAYPWWAYERS